MSIGKVPFPASVPAAVSDYQKQNALLAALVKAVDGAQKIVGGNVVQGAVFNVGGTLYVATSDTAITGVASDYVKLTPSGDTLTLAPSYVASLSGVTWNEEYKGYYDVSGNLYEFDEAKAWDAEEITTLYTHGGISTKAHGKAVFLASGSWRAPTGVKNIYLTGCAHGNNGEGGGSGFGNGGNGGGWGFKEEITVIPGTLYTVTIGGLGSPSSFGALKTYAVSGGGAGGSATTPAGAGYSAGGFGGTLVDDARIGGGGGGSLGSGGHGGNAYGFNKYPGGNGGYGGGGGGGGQASDGVRAAGGLGGPAIIVVEW